jgi:hypothetical protein
MGFFKSLLKVAKIAAPIALNFIPGVGPLASAALGAGIGAMGGGGLKGALIGGAGGYLGAGGLTSTAAGGLGNTFIGQGVNSFNSGLGSLLGTAASSPLSGIGPISQGSGILGALGGVGTALNSVGGGISNLLSSTGLSSGSVGGSSSGGGFLSSLLGGGSSSGGGLSLGGLGNVGSTLFSQVQGTNALNKARSAQLGANQAAINTISPYLQSGGAANTRLSALLGLDPNADQTTIQDTLRNSPGYQFRLSEGQNALDRSLGAKGNLFSGRAIKAGQEFGQGLADQTYNNYISQLTNQANAGQQAAGNTAELYGQQGDIQSSSTMAKSNLLNSNISQLLNPQDAQQRKLLALLTGKMVA